MKKKEYRFRNIHTGEVDYIEVEINASVQYGAPGRQRKNREKPTPEAVRKNNERIRKNRIRRLLIANFEENDYWITLTWKKERRVNTLAEAKKQVQQFLRKVRRFFEKVGESFKYIGVLERGVKGALHFHIVMNRINDLDLILSKWKEGHVNITPTYQEGKFRQLADYIGKDQDERWLTRSRNLIEPQVREKKIKLKANWFSKGPKPKKGYEIIKDTIYTGINPVTNKLYMHYSMQKGGSSGRNDKLRTTHVQSR